MSLAPARSMVMVFWEEHDDYSGSRGEGRLAGTLDASTGPSSACFLEQMSWYVGPGQLRTSVSLSFLIWTIFEVFIQFVTILLLF